MVDVSNRHPPTSPTQSAHHAHPEMLPNTLSSQTLHPEAHEAGVPAPAFDAAALGGGLAKQYAQGALEVLMTGAPVKESDLQRFDSIIRNQIPAFEETVAQIGVSKMARRLPSSICNGDYFPGDPPSEDRVRALLTAARGTPSGPHIAIGASITDTNFVEYVPHIAQAWIEVGRHTLHTVSDNMVRMEQQEAALRAQPLHGLDIPPNTMLFIDTTAGRLLPKDISTVRDKMQQAGTKHVRILADDIDHAGDLRSQLVAPTAPGAMVQTDVRITSAKSMAKLDPQARQRSIDYIASGQAHILSRAKDPRGHALASLTRLSSPEQTPSTRIDRQDDAASR